MSNIPTVNELVKHFEKASNIKFRDDLSEMRKKMVLNKLSAFEKDSLSVRKKELEEKVSSGMPTHSEMWKPTDENIRKHRNWENKWSKEIDELKNVNRRLEPENPNSGRIEYLRKQGEADKLAKWV